MRSFAFAGRNCKEILRDPLSYVFCLCLPVFMLVFMNKVFYGDEAFWFSLDLLTPGIMVFAYAFTMLYMTLLVSRDRSTAFLNRLFSAPLRAVDFILGYALPGLVLALAQGVICGLTGLLLSLGGEEPLRLTGLLLCLGTQLPLMLFYIFLGIFFGTLLSDKAAPGISSIFISAGGMFSGAWMPIEMYKTTAAGFYQFCRVLPFYPSTAAGRYAMGLTAQTEQLLAAMGLGFDASDCLYGVLLGTGCALAAGLAAVLLFGKRMRGDIR